jgi:hypothetical protein
MGQNHKAYMRFIYINRIQVKLILLIKSDTYNKQNISPYGFLHRLLYKVTINTLDKEII